MAWVQGEALGHPFPITCSLLSFLVMASGPDSTGLAGNSGADARSCEGRLFLGSAASPGLRSSDRGGWHCAWEERDSRQQGLRPAAAAGTFFPLSQSADVGALPSTFTHACTTCMRTHGCMSVHAHTCTPSSPHGCAHTCCSTLPAFTWPLSVAPSTVQGRVQEPHEPQSEHSRASRNCAAIGEGSFAELLQFLPPVPLLEGREGLGLLLPLSPLLQSKGTQALLRGSSLWKHTSLIPRPHWKCSCEERGYRALAVPSQSLSGDTAFHREPRGRHSAPVRLTQANHSL